MEELNIFRQIDRELNEWKTQSVQIVPGYKFNQRKMIEKIYRFYNSQFQDGEYDSEGFKKFFFNIVRNPCNVATKAVDFDTKDIQLITPPGQNPIKTWLAERDLKFWMKEKKFGEVLNRIFYELPIFGSVVLKKIGSDFYFVDLRNLILEQSADHIEDSSYVIELHYYSPDELRKQKWENIEETIKMWRGTGTPYIRVIERYGEVPEPWLKEDGDPTKYVYSRFIVYCREGKPQQERKYEVSPVGYILSKSEIDKEKEFPYWDIHWEKIPGRWLGIGRVEVLLDTQIRINELINLRVKSSYFSALNIFQTSDETIKKNVLTDMKMGEIVYSRTGITRIPTEERNLTAFETEHNRWLQNRDEVTMAYDVIRGERLPAGTPLGAAQLAAMMTTSYYDQIRENIALDIKYFLMEKVMPEFIKERSAEHYLKLVGEDLKKWQEYLIQIENENAKWRFLKENGTLPSPLQYELMKMRNAEKIKSKKEHHELIPKNYYADLKYDIDIEITGEALDIRVRAMNLQMALQAITVDPTLLTDPTKRKIFSRILEMAGIRLEDIEAEVPPEEITALKKEKEIPKRAGGGVSAPVVMPTPIKGEMERVI